MAATLPRFHREGAETQSFWKSIRGGATISMKLFRAQRKKRAFDIGVGERSKSVLRTDPMAALRS